MKVDIATNGGYKSPFDRVVEEQSKNTEKLVNVYNYNTVRIIGEIKQLNEAVYELSKKGFTEKKVLDCSGEEARAIKEEIWWVFNTEEDVWGAYWATHSAFNPSLCYSLKVRQNAFTPTGYKTHWGLVIYMISKADKAKYSQVNTSQYVYPYKAGENLISIIGRYYADKKKERKEAKKKK